MTRIPIKVYWNATNSCNLKCKFCYHHFDKDYNTLSTGDVVTMVNLIKTLGAQILVITGGEPLLRKDMVDIIAFAHKIGLKVTLDTNALLLNHEIIENLNDILDWIGLPLDGSSVYIETLIRDNQDLFPKVIDSLEFLSRTNIKIKINTVLCKYNASDMLNIAEVIKRFNIDLWSIYQFWPLERGRFSKSIFEIPTRKVNEIYGSILKQYPNLKIECVPITRRKNSYFFISHTGRVYIIPGSFYRACVEIGNIFDKNFLLKYKTQQLINTKQLSRLATKMELHTN